MKASRGVTVAGLSAALVATGWAVGTGFTTPAHSAESAATTDGTSASTTQAQGSTSSSSSSAVSEPTASASASSSASAQSTPASTYDGASVDTRYGAFQVEITVENGQVTDIAMLENGERDPRSQSINAQAIPMLTARVLDAQSANVDAVSGASFTSYGFLTSVESALQEAGLA